VADVNFNQSIRHQK